MAAEVASVRGLVFETVLVMEVMKAMDWMTLVILEFDCRRLVERM